MIPTEILSRHVDQHPFPLLFATISGAHLYGFPSADSDFDLRGVHVLPIEDVVGLHQGTETVDRTTIDDGLEIDLVTHDVQKFFNLMLKKNGYVLEQVCSPLIIHRTPEFDELKSLVSDCVTRHHSHHYLGFAANQWKLFRKDDPPRVKPLLYMFRVLLTGIHLMQTGIIEANLLTLNEKFQLPMIDDLVARKVGGAEKEAIDQADMPHLQREYESLEEQLKVASAESTLPEVGRAKPALHDLLLRLRLAGSAPAR